MARRNREEAICVLQSELAARAEANAPKWDAYDRCLADSDFAALRKAYVQKIDPAEQDATLLGLLNDRLLDLLGDERSPVNGDSLVALVMEQLKTDRLNDDLPF